VGINTLSAMPERATRRYDLKPMGTHLAGLTDSEKGGFALSMNLKKDGSSRKFIDFLRMLYQLTQLNSVQDDESIEIRITPDSIRRMLDSHDSTEHDENENVQPDVR